MHFFLAFDGILYRTCPYRLFASKLLAIFYTLCRQWVFWSSTKAWSTCARHASISFYSWTERWPAWRTTAPMTSSCVVSG